MKTVLGRARAWRIACISACCLALAVFHFGRYNDARLLLMPLGLLTPALWFGLFTLEWKLAGREIEPSGVAVSPGKVPAAGALGQRRTFWALFRSAKVRMLFYGGLALMWMGVVWWLCIRDTPSWLIYVKPSVEQLAFSADGTRLAVISGYESSEMIEVWDWRNRRTVEGQDFTPPNSRPDRATPGAAISPDGQFRAEATPDQRHCQVTNRTGQVLHQWDEYTFPDEFSPNGELLVCRDTKTPASLRVWSVTTGKPIATFQVVPPDHYAGGVQDVRFVPDAKRLLTTVREGAFQLWDAETGKLTLTLIEDRKRPDAGQGFSELKEITFHPSGRYVAALYRDRGESWASIVFWDLTTGKAVKKLPTPYLKGQTRNTLKTLAFSPDGRCLASGSDRRRPVSDQYATYVGDGPGLWDAPLYVWELNLR